MFVLLFVSFFLMEGSIVQTLLNIPPLLPPGGGGVGLPANGSLPPPPAGCERTNYEAEF